MPGAIGDYVHYLADNYRRYNLGKDKREGPDLSSSLATAKDNLSSMLAMVSSTVKTEELSRFLTNLIYKKEDFVGEQLSISSAAIQQYEERFKVLVEEKFHTLQANLDDLTLENVGLQGVKASTIDMSRSTGVKKSTVIAAANNIELMLQSLGSVRNVDNIEAIRQQAKEVQSKLQGLLASVQSDKDVIISYEAAGGKDAEGNIFALYNNLIRSMQGPTKEQMGTLAEMYFSYMLMSAAGTVDISLDQLLNDFVTGANRSNNQISRLSRSNIDVDLLQKRLNVYYDKNGKARNNTLAPWSIDFDDGGIATLTQGGAGAQGTVDMSLTFKEDSALASEFGVNRLNASIKNYGSVNGFFNFKKGYFEGIHVITGYNVMAALMLFDTDFINHYLNLIASHEDGLLDTTEVNDALTEGIAVRALSGAKELGNSTNEMLSDVFIVNDRAARQVRVVSTPQLVKRIWSNLKDYVEVIGLPTHVAMTWQGESPNDGDASIRIANLIANLHQAKLSMSLKPAFWDA